MICINVNYQLAHQLIANKLVIALADDNLLPINMKLEDRGQRSNLGTVTSEVVDLPREWTQRSFCSLSFVIDCLFVDRWLNSVGIYRRWREPRDYLFTQLICIMRHWRSSCRSGFWRHFFQDSQGSLRILWGNLQGYWHFWQFVVRFLRDSWGFLGILQDSYHFWWILEDF